MSIDLAEIVGWRTALGDEIPRGAQTVANRAVKSGWSVRIMFSRVPWLTADGEEQEGDEDNSGLVQTISVQGRRGDAKFHANWRLKLWTKDDAYKFAGAAMWPPIEGECIATKAKATRHPEHLGAKTVGGLKNSKTLNDYLKETT